MPTPGETAVAEHRVQHPTWSDRKIVGMVYSPATAHAKASKIMRQRGVRERVAVLCDEVEIDETRLAQKLSDLLDAERTITIRGPQGQRQEISVPDNQTQFRALELCLKLSGWLRDGRDDPTVQTERIAMVIQQVVERYVPVTEQPQALMLAADLMRGREKWDCGRC